jgi:hypothetical protein
LAEDHGAFDPAARHRIVEATGDRGDDLATYAGAPSKRAPQLAERRSGGRQLDRAAVAVGEEKPRHSTTGNGAMKITRRLPAIALGLLASVQSAVASAGEPAPTLDPNQTPSVEELAKLKQNPLSGLREVIFQVVVNTDTPVDGKSQVVYSLQPVWPFSINDDWKLITYSILPLIKEPGVAGEDSILGLGDTLINLYVSPKNPGPVVWGVGPAILLPTRTDPALGSNRLGLGPAAVLFYQKGNWGTGVVLQNLWSLGGSDINRVNEFAAQYILNYNLPNGWFLYSNATITADWLANKDDRWTVPVGGGVGRLFKIGKQPVSLSAQLFSNVVTPTNGPNLTGIVQFSIIIP